MPVETHVDRARTRAEAEREAIEAKAEAFEAFCDRVSVVRAVSAPAATGATATAGTQLRTDSAGEDRCRAVRTAFAETVRPHSVADVDEAEPLLETVREELTDAVAVALAPTTGARFTAELKRMVLAETRARRAETAALREALDRERTHLREATETVDEVTAWLAEADETPLSDLGFDALEARHDRLAGHRTRCERLARDRQGFLRETTTEAGDAGIRHRDLVPYLYRDFPVDHPVLATAARLDDVCSDCQQAVRDHLVRRA